MDSIRTIIHTSTVTKFVEMAANGTYLQSFFFFFKIKIYCALGTCAQDRAND